MTAREYVTDGHLGGYRRGGDEATLYPDLWRWLVEELGVRSVIDVGCGEGQALAAFRELGCFVLGVEGIPQPGRPEIVRHDYAEGPFVPSGPRTPRREFDLGWCCEFVEHVEERYVPNFLETLRCARLVLMTHAEPGQGGYHHVNERLAPYWIERLAEAGFELDAALTSGSRHRAATNPSPWNHFVRSGLAFRRAD